VPKIHPTAIVDSRAELADDVEIGPHCIIEGPVTIGPGTRLVGHAYVQGPGRIGEGNIIYPFACVGFAPQHRATNPRELGAGFVLGDRNILRENVTIHRAIGDHPTTLGNENFLMVNAHIAHDVMVEDHCTFTNGSALGGHAHVEERVTLGGNAMVHQFCRVGRLSMLSGNMGVAQDLPPFCTSYANRSIGSLNLVGLRRMGLRDHIPNLQKAFDLVFKKAQPNLRAVERLEQELGHDPLCMELAEFIRQSKRGICPYLEQSTDPGVVVRSPGLLAEEVADEEAAGADDIS